jgi:sulfur carrier protein ThiS
MPKVTFKLFAMLSDHLPDEVDGVRRQGNAIELSVPQGTTVQQLIDRFALPPKLVHLVLVNGTYVAPADRATRCLADGEALAVWPPIAGG